MQILDYRIHPRLFCFHTYTDGTDVLEAASSDKEHKLYHIAILQVEDFVPLDWDDELMVDEFGLEAL